MPTIDFTFKVRKCEPEVIVPANPTPHEFKQLSDMDDHQSLRFQIPLLNFYEHNPNLEGRDSVKIIKEAIARTLVFYYPFAGRLREGPGRKLFVECTGEGILFIEADADVTLEQFGDALQFSSSLSWFQDVIYNVPNSDSMVNSPLLLIQVTRLKCGGFIFAIRLNHTMADGFGLVQLMKAIAEIARGAYAPSIFPVWQRALLTARDPPRITCRHPEYDQVPVTNDTAIPIDNMAHRFIFFSPLKISALRQTLPAHLRHCSSFELIAAYVWRLRTIVLQLSPEEKVCFVFPVNLRTKINSLPLGYYGNVLVFPAELTTVANLCGNPLGHAVELIRKAKAKVTNEYVNSLLDLVVMKGRSLFTAGWPYIVSDLRRVGFEEVDFGWGKAVYGGLTAGGFGTFPGTLSFCISFVDKKGEKGIMVPLCLPALAMERFMAEFDALTNVEQLVDEVDSHQQRIVASVL
ncbi:benzyl alcohol O-benzoyltransferase-like [Cucurbita pepo subsp. pepo]|uniref:benzyl alcohol O-benzoyltransferase-like n=1 Tax=Cucurbita pepo subsp. pepo TaxID=3664 RepID=UPI000C9D8880|nr:benzyl alcohol O-benzoyltransferase-like [Cucurbita pepo subsp. pepo]